MSLDFAVPAGLPLDERGIGLGAAFRGFLVVGLTGFGGVLPVIVHEFVRRRGWISVEEFTEILSLCQILPGPNVINFTVVFGIRLRGWRGAMACLLGLMTLPVLLAIGMAVLHASYGDIPAVARAVEGVAAAAAGLIAATALRLAWPMRREPVTLALVALVVVMAGVWRLPLPLIVLLIGPVGICVGFWQARRAMPRHG